MIWVTKRIGSCEFVGVLIPLTFPCQKEGKSLTVLGMSIAAPRWQSVCTTERRPKRLAICSGVSPFWSLLWWWKIHEANNAIKFMENSVWLCQKNGLCWWKFKSFNKHSKPIKSAGEFLVTSSWRSSLHPLVISNKAISICERRRARCKAVCPS